MANDINSVVLVGRLTRDADLNYTNSGTPVSKFSLAVNRKKRSGDSWIDEVSFFDIVLWGKLGESLQQYLLKGKQVCVQGELKQDRWEKDGHARSKVGITATGVQLLGGNISGSSGSQNSSSSFGGFAPSGSSGGNAFTKGQENQGSMEFDDDIPF